MTLANLPLLNCLTAQ